MKQILTVAVCILSAFCFKQVFPQSDSIKYTTNFEFTDGIYQTFDEFKKNDPSIKEKAIIADNPEVQVLLGVFAKAEKIAFNDSNGNLQKLKRNDVWGFCSNEEVFVLVNNNFHKIFKIGSILYFAESTYAFFSPDGSTSLRSPTKFVQYMIDYKTGNVMKYNLNNFLFLLKRDNELSAEFASINSNRKKKDQMFQYLIRFNKRNPIYF